MAFGNFVIRSGILKLLQEPVTLSSGIKTHLYFDCRDKLNDVAVMEKVAGYAVDFLKNNDLRPRTILGVPDGATNLASQIIRKYAESQIDYGTGAYFYSQMRKFEKKNHGLLETDADRYFVGKPRGDTIIFEDVTTSGESIIKTVKRFRAVDLNARIKAAVSLIDRDEKRIDRRSAKEAIESMGVPYYTMCHASDILVEACQILHPDYFTAKAIEDEYLMHGIKPVTLIKEGRLNIT